MIILDTNVVSELLKPRPEPSVERWMASESAESLFITVLTEAELRLGAAMMPAGKRKKVITDAVDAALSELFAERTLPFDSFAVGSYTAVMLARRQAGRPITLIDAQIAAIARANGAAVATRNVTDFAACGVEIINPWNPQQRQR